MQKIILISIIFISSLSFAKIDSGKFKRSPASEKDEAAREALYRKMAMDITKIFYGPQDDLERKEGGSRAHYESTSYSPKNDKIKVIISRTSRYQSCKIESTFDAEGHDNYQLKIEDCKDK